MYTRRIYIFPLRVLQPHSPFLHPVLPLRLFPRVWKKWWSSYGASSQVRCFSFFFFFFLGFHFLSPLKYRMSFYQSWLFSPLLCLNETLSHFEQHSSRTTQTNIHPRIYSQAIRLCSTTIKIESLIPGILGVILTRWVSSAVLFSFSKERKRAEAIGKEEAVA